MTAITISREIGSQGDWIAEQVAKKLGYRLVNKQTLERIFVQYGFVDFNETYDRTGFWARLDRHHSDMISMLNRTNQALAAHGQLVLVGRGGFATLKDFADVLNVRIQAPILMRIEQVMHEFNLTEISAAEALVDEQDQLRKDFLHSAYGSRWNSADEFDLVIDTGKIAPQIASNLLVESVHNLGRKISTTQRSCHELVVDPVLERTINEIIDPELAF